jgi:hypothetical protein
MGETVRDKKKRGTVRVRGEGEQKRRENKLKRGKNEPKGRGQRE